MKKHKYGLYTNGKTVVSLYETDGRLFYQRELPFCSYGENMTPSDFYKNYPIQVSSVEVQRGTKKVATVNKYGLYTNGKTVVCVHAITETKVKYTLELPFKRRLKEMNTAEFIKTYLYRPNSVELD